MKKLKLLCLLGMFGVFGMSCGCAANDCVIVVGPGEGYNEEDVPSGGEVTPVRAGARGANVERSAPRDESTARRAPRIL